MRFTDGEMWYLLKKDVEIEVETEFFTLLLDARVRGKLASEVAVDLLKAIVNYMITFTLHTTIRTIHLCHDLMC